MTKVPTILSLDTATNTASVALWRDGHLVGEASHEATGHSSALLRSVDEVCAAAGVGAAAFTAIAVGLGPGSFTGVRIGMATAKGLAYAAQIPLWGASSLAALAYDAFVLTPAAQVAIAIANARRNEVFVGAFARSATHHAPQPLGEEAVLAPAAVAAWIQTRITMVSAEPIATNAVVIAGDGCAAYPTLHTLPYPHAAIATPRAGAIAILAAAGDRTDLLHDGSPLYIRPSEAEVNYPNGVPGALRKRPVLI